MSDIRQRRTYENVGTFVAKVTALQPNMTEDQALAWIEEYRQKYPLLYHGIDQIDSFLDIMRGSVFCKKETALPKIS